MARRTEKKSVDSPDSIADWLKGVEATKCGLVRARHMQAGQDAMSVVATFAIDDDGKFSSEEIWERLTTDAEGYGGFQRYQLLAYLNDSSRDPRDRLPVNIDGGSLGGENGGPTEGPNAIGLVSQAHRHLEATMRSLITSHASIVNSLTSQLAAKDVTIEKLLEERTEVWELMRAMNVAEADKIKKLAESRSQERKEELMAEAVKLLIPGVINKIAPSADAQSTAVAGLIASLDDDQRGKIFSLLRPEQAAALMSLLDEKIAKDEKTATKEEAK